LETGGARVNEQRSAAGNYLGPMDFSISKIDELLSQWESRTPNIILII
jgi:hypothetical protein